MTVINKHITVLSLVVLVCWTACYLQMDIAKIKGFYAPVSIIPDGHHVDYAALRIAKQVMKERLFVITDAVTETGKGYYPHELAGDKYEASGILSGSALTMGKAVQNLVHHAGISPEEALRMCSLYPARVVGLEKESGKIAEGYKATMVVMDEKMDVKKLLNT
ncbi:MAG: amidohydrolase family protein [Bacteroidota bacterium]